MAEEIANAQGLAKKKKLKEAVDLLQTHLRNSFSKREALLWRLALSQILISSKKVKMAMPHLVQILSDIEDFKLEQWDPDLALNGHPRQVRRTTGSGAKPTLVGETEVSDRFRALSRRSREGPL